MLLGFTSWQGWPPCSGCSPQTGGLPGVLPSAWEWSTAGLGAAAWLRVVEAVQGTPPAATELSLNPWLFPCPAAHWAAVLYALLRPFPALGYRERRACGLLWQGACGHLQSGFSSGFVLEPLTELGLGQEQQVLKVQVQIYPRLVVTYLPLGSPPLSPTTTGKAVITSVYKPCDLATSPTLFFNIPAISRQTC